MDYREAFHGGMRAYRQGEYPAAIEALRPLLDRPDLPGRLARYYSAMAHRALGVDLVEAGEFPQAGVHLRQAVQLVGNRADLAEYLFIVYARTGQYDLCAAEAEVLAGSGGEDDAAAHVRLAQAQWRSGQRPLSIMTLTAALRQRGDRADLHLNLGLLYAADEQYDLARKHLVRAAECDCTLAKAYRYLGLVESARGDFHAAARAFGRAMELNPQDLLSAYQLCLAADAAAKAGRPIQVALPEARRPPAESVIRQLAEYAAGEPDFVGAFLALPPSAVDGELFGVVVAILRTALGLHPEYADLHYLTAAALARAGDESAAAVHARRAVEINGRYVKALVLLADLQTRAGQYAAALANLQQALAAGADWPDVHARLGDLLKQSGEIDPARSHYERALSLNGRYERAAQGLAALAA